MTERKDKELEHHTVFKKEILTLRNDLYYQFFENKKGRWFFDISYKPLHQPSGDSYSIRKVGEDKIFVFVVDAMGKGITASITSIMSSSFLNYLVDKHDKAQDFDLKICVGEYHDYIKHLIFLMKWYQSLLCCLTLKRTNFIVLFLECLQYFYKTTMTKSSI